MSQRKAREARRNASEQAQPKRSRRTRIGLALGVAAVVVTIVAGVLVARGTGPAESVRVVSGSTVSFSGTDPVTGKAVSLDDYAGKPVVVNVWGSWCPGCIDEATDLRRFAERHQDVQVIGVDMQDTKEGARDFYERWEWTHPSVFDPQGEIAFSLGLQGTPSTFYLDRSHRMVTRIVGATDLAGFEQGLEEALSTT